MNKPQHILTSLLALLAVAFASCAEEETPMPAPGGEGKQPIMLGGKLFAEFVHAKTEAYGEIDRPFIYPIIGPTGAHMTRAYPMRTGVPNEASDHPHHRSLWFAHGNVNGIDFWHKGNNSGTIQTKSVSVLDAEKIEIDSARLSGIPENAKLIMQSEAWVGPAPQSKTLLDARTTYAFALREDNSRSIDILRTHSVADGVNQVTFGDTKEGTMAIRVHPALRLKGQIATGHCINSEGHKDGDCWGKRAKWVAYWGVIDGKTVGVAVFDHPTNLRHPTWWHARDYGLVAANPFGIHDFEKKPRGTGDFVLKEGETLDLRYRFIFFEGDAQEADIAGQYEQWVTDTTPSE